MQIFISVHLDHTKHSKTSNAVQSMIFNLWEASNEKPQKEERVCLPREIKFFFKSQTTMPTKYFLCTKDMKAQKWWSQESLKHND